MSEKLDTVSILSIQACRRVVYSMSYAKDYPGGSMIGDERYWYNNIEASSARGPSDKEILRHSQPATRNLQ